MNNSTWVLNSTILSTVTSEEKLNTILTEQQKAAQDLLTPLDNLKTRYESLKKAAEEAAKAAQEALNKAAEL